MWKTVVRLVGLCIALTYAFASSVLFHASAMNALHHFSAIPVSEHCGNQADVIDVEHSLPPVNCFDLCMSPYELLWWSVVLDIPLFICIDVLYNTLLSYDNLELKDNVFSYHVIDPPHLRLFGDADVGELVKIE